MNFPIEVIRYSFYGIKIVFSCAFLLGGSLIRSLTGTYL